MKIDISISVVIPTYNRGKLLLRAIASVLNQTYPVSEIIICDDGSDDNSFELVSDLAEPKIKWVNCGRNGRPAIPRNIGINESKSEWISFLDSDDEWLPDKIEKQVEIIYKYKSLAVCSNANRIIENENKGNYLNFYGNKIKFRHLLHTNFIVCSSVILNKRLIDTTSKFSESDELKAIEDFDLWLKISARTDFYYIETPLLNYYDNPLISIRSDSLSENSIRNAIFNSFISWKNKYPMNTPYFDKKSFYRATRQTILFKMESQLIKVINKFFYHTI